MAAATGGTLSFFGGAKEAQDQSMRDTMQRESAEELVLISKHGRPSRQPIHYGAQIATVTLFKYEIHLFVAQIEAEVDVVPSESEQTKTASNAPDLVRKHRRVLQASTMPFPLRHGSRSQSNSV